MIISFNKFHGTGNDFIITDNRSRKFSPPTAEIIRNLCDRRTGIGADGFILLEPSGIFDYEMKYFNSDGHESSMCGNGGRCAAAFALGNRLAGKTQKFLASDGPHEAVVEDGNVKLHLSDVTDYELINGNYFINTGSPHYVVFRQDTEEMDVHTEGKMLRHSGLFSPSGTNVNFARVDGSNLFVRTFERGVEDETLSCGTGATASAIAAVLSGQIDSNNIQVSTRGGGLNVSFIIKGERITDVWLSGPAVFVFRGEVEVQGEKS